MCACQAAHIPPQPHTPPPTLTQRVCTTRAVHTCAACVCLVAQLQWGDGLLRNGSRISEAAYPACSVATDCAGDQSDCAAPFCIDATTLQRGRQFQPFHNTPVGRWKKVLEGLIHSRSRGSRISAKQGKRQSDSKHGNSSGAMDCYVTVKGSSVGQERTPCQIRTHSSQVRERAIQRGDGVGLSQDQRSHAAGKVRGSTTSSMQRRGEVSQSIHWGWALEWV